MKIEYKEGLIVLKDQDEEAAELNCQYNKGTYPTNASY